MIRHKDEIHAGLHPAIIDQPLYDTVQLALAANRVKRGGHSLRAATARLTGRIISETGAPFTPSFSYGRGGRTYRYYVAELTADAGSIQDGRPHRLPAEPLETFVQETLARLAGRPAAAWGDLDPLLVMIEVKPRETHLILNAKRLFGSEHPEFGLDRLRERLVAGEQAVAEPGQPSRLRIRLPIPLRFRGGRSWRVGGIDGGADLDGAQPARPDPSMIDGLRKAHAILAEQGIDLAGRRVAADAQAPAQSYQRKLCLLALLAPNMQRSILEGRAPRNITLQGLLDRGPPPLLWSRQPAWAAGRS